MSDSCVPWFQIPDISLERVRDQQKGQVPYDADVIVVGAGIAGASAAFELAERGYSVLVLERAEKPATLGSGNRQGMLYLKLSPNLTYQNDLITQGFEKTLSVLMTLTERDLLVKGVDWDDTGLLQLAQTPKQLVNQQKLAQMYDTGLLYPVDQIEASDIAGVALTAGGLFYPRSGWVAPRQLVKALLKHPNISLQADSQVIGLTDLAQSEKRAGEVSQGQILDCQTLINSELTDSLWSVAIADQKSVVGRIVILAMADQVTMLSQCESIPFTIVRGQTTSVDRGCDLKVVVSGEGYVAPSKQMNGGACTTFGATFHRDQQGGNPTLAEHRENIEMLALNSSELVTQLGLSDLLATDGWVKNSPEDQGSTDQGCVKERLEGRAATRASAMGSLPIVGPIADRELFLERFKAIRLDAKAVPDAPVPWLRGLYLTTAHGSRGMITAPIAGEMLAHYLEGDVSQYSEELRAAIHPNRFYYRELRFNQFS